MFGVTGIEHQVAIVQDLRLMKQENEALLRQREENERENARNLATHKEAIAQLKKTLEEEIALRKETATRLQEEVALGKGTAARLEAENALRNQTTARLEEEIVLRDQQLSQFERENASRRMELEWLYRWLPFNRIARRLFYGKGLRRRFFNKLGWRA